MFAHLPVLKFLDDLGARSFVSEVWGASGGAIVGLLYSMGVPAERIREEGYKSLNAQRDIRIVPSTLAVLSKIIFESILPNFSFLSNGKSEADILKGFHDCQAGLQDFLVKVAQGNPLRFPFYCLAYNMDKQQTDVLTPVELPYEYYSDWLFPADPVEAVLASSAVPILFVPKVIQDGMGRRVYVDGATVEDVPTESVYRKWKRDRELGIEKRKRLLIIAVNFYAYFSSIGFLKNWALRRIPGFYYLLLGAQYADLMRQARTRVQKQLLTDDPSVELWDIRMKMPTGGLMNVEDIPKVIQLAQRQCEEQFRKIHDSLLI